MAAPDGQWTSIGPTIETARLILRPPMEEDFEAWAHLMGDPEASPFLGGPLPREMAWRSMALMAGSWALRSFGMFSVIEKASGDWIGRLGPWQPEGWPGPEIGWGLLPQYQGRGYATEGAARTIDWAFDQLGWDRIIHGIHPENMASQAVAARLGSQYLGPGNLPPPYSDDPIELWGQTKAEWRSSRAHQ